MPVNKCRVCERGFMKEPLLRYENMPKVAQFLPAEKDLKSDRGVDLEIYQCSGCGLIQLNSDPVPYYRQVIRATAVSDEMNEFRTKQFGDFAQRFSLNGKRVIEIGCGRGEFLSILRKVGMDAYGLEDSEEAVRWCVGEGLKVSRGYVENEILRINGGPFDAFCMLNFLEHLPEPNSVLGGIYNNISENAVGLVEVPNFDMILRKNLFSEFATDHLLYFTKDTLSTVLRLNGFEVIECSEIWHEYILSAVVIKRQRLEMYNFSRHHVHLQNELKDYIEQFHAGKVAVWGAGHQALAILSMTNLSGKIRYVIDSAVFKQGKYTPATHIPIVSPETLVLDPVDTVIVMAASYSNEVVKIIKEKFGQKIKLAVLRDYGLEITC